MKKPPVKKKKRFRHPPDFLATAEWVKDMCLMAGSEIFTAYLVAGYFVQGLERPSDERD